jgi:hypothetical protein
MSDRYTARVESLRHAVEDGPGELESGLRKSVAARAAEHCHGDAGTSLPPDLVAYVDKVALHAYKVMNDDIETLKQGGRSEDEIFELTVAAAVGAALERLDLGLQALGKSAQ